jgi:hypothetical protein
MTMIILRLSPATDNDADRGWGFLKGMPVKNFDPPNSLRTPGMNQEIFASVLKFGFTGDKQG